jgi:YbbR domain-containing protein
MLRSMPRGLRKVASNAGWALASLALAIVVWYAAHSSQDPLREARYPDPLPIQLNIPEGYVLVSSGQSSGRVTVRTLQSVWDELQASDLRLEADLNGLSEGTHTVALSASLLGPTGRITAIQPRQITVTLAKRAEKLVAINTVFTAPLPSDYQVEAIPDVEAVRVSGPQASVEAVAEIILKVSLADQRQSFSRTFSLTALDAEGRTISDVKLEPAEIMVQVRISPRNGN